MTWALLPFRAAAAFVAAALWLEKPPKLRVALPTWRIGTYFSAVDTLVKVLFRAVPRLFTTAMIAIEMPAAISPYSIAVAPRSSVRNFLTKILMWRALFDHPRAPQYTANFCDILIVPVVIDETSG